MSRSTISTFKLFEMFPDAESARKYTEISGGDDVFYLVRIGAELCLLPGERLSPEDFRGLSI